MPATAWGAVPVRRFCSLVRAAAFLSLVLGAAGAAGAGISGVGFLPDGDTLRIGSESIRLHGIDAPELVHSWPDPPLRWRSADGALAGVASLPAPWHVECPVGAGPAPCDVTDPAGVHRSEVAGEDDEFGAGGEWGMVFPSNSTWGSERI